MRVYYFLMATEIELAPGIITPPIHRLISNVMIKIMKRKDISVLNSTDSEININSIFEKLEEQKYNTVSEWDGEIRSYLDDCTKSEDACKKIVAEEVLIYLNKKVPFIIQCSEFHFRTLTNHHINELFQILHITDDEYDEYAHKYRIVKRIIDNKIRNAKKNICADEERIIPILSMPERYSANPCIVVDDYGLKKPNS